MANSLKHRLSLIFLSNKHSKIKPQNRRIKPWLENFSEAYFEQTVSIRYEVAKNSYLKQLSVLFDNIKFSGISIASQESLRSEKLSRIFVVPDVMEERILPLSYMQELQVLSEYVQEDKDIFHEIHLQKKHGRRFLATQIFTQTRSKKVVLLGAPGSGKTLLISFLAVMLTQDNPNYQLLGLDPHKNWLPILVRIRDWVREPECSLLEYIKKFAKKNLLLTDLPSDFYEYWLGKGQALILLDGLDEVSDVNRRYSIADLISTFLSKYNQNLAVITSRPTGYSPSFFTKDEPCHLSLQPFDPPKIDLFINNWYKSRFNDSSEALRWQTNLKIAISQNDRIKLLAKNPLLLTIIALVHRYEAYLPRHRHTLYNRAVETLLTNWDTGKELNYVWPLDYLKRDSIRRLMERLAYWIHTQGKEPGMSEGGTLISRDDLIEQLRKFIQEEDLSLKHHQAELEAERFLKHIRDRSGLLNEQSPGYYAFVHKTFQEYLTTQEIRDRQEEGFDIVTDHISDYLHDSHWREVLLMLIAQQKRTNFQKVLAHVFKYLDPYEPYLYRTLLFACSCLAEDVTSQDSELIDHILLSLVELDISPLPIVTEKIRNEIQKIISSLSGTRYAPLLYKHILENQSSLEQAKFLKYKALLDDHKQAIPKLICLLKNPSSKVRMKAAEALGDIEDKSPQTIEALSSLLNDSEFSVRLSAIKAIGNIGIHNLSVIDTLFILLKDNYAQVRTQVIEVLSRMGYASEEVKNHLIQSLQHQKPDVGYRIIEILCRMGVQSEKVSTYLMSNILIEDSIHDAAPKFIGELGDASKNVVDALLDNLKNTISYKRSRSLEALGRLGDSSENILLALRKCLDDDDDFVIYKAVEALERLGDKSQHLQVALLRLLENNNLCSLSIEAIGRIGFDSDSVKDSLKFYLNNRDLDLRCKSAEALGRLGDVSDNVVNILLNNLEDVDPKVRFTAIELLGSLGKKSDKILDSLLKLVGDERANRSNIAAAILGNIENTSQHVLDVLTKKLNDSNPLICCNAASVLIQLGNTESISINIEKKVIDTLLTLLGCEIGVVINRATTAFSQLGKRDLSISNYLTDWIVENENHESVGLVVDVLWDLVQDKRSSEKNYKVTM